MTSLIFSTLLALQPAFGFTTNSERVQNNAEYTQNRIDLRDDTRDLAELSRLIDNWHSTQSGNDRATERAIDRQILAWLDREVSENQRDTLEARAEVADSIQELNGEKRDVYSSRGRSGARTTAMAEVYDDTRDLADDRRDLITIQNEQSRVLAISKTLNQMQSKFDSNRASNNDYSQKSSLLRELQRLAKSEIARDRAELVEDAYERQEDHRDR